MVATNLSKAQQFRETVEATIAQLEDCIQDRQRVIEREQWRQQQDVQALAYERGKLDALGSLLTLDVGESHGDATGEAGEATVEKLKSLDDRSQRTRVVGQDFGARIGNGKV